jgi:hypothetical protein
MCGGGLLFTQCLLKMGLSLSDESLIPRTVDKDAGAVLRVVLEFGEHTEISTMGSEKYVTGQASQHGEGMLEILNDAGVTDGVVRCID